jgi:hypothetical protein
MPRYVVADPALGRGWSHIFSERNSEGKAVERERLTRFIYDTERQMLVQLDVDHQGLIPADGVETADVEDSLKNANPEAIEDPDENGLIGTDELPDWCRIPAPPAPAR